MTKKRTDAELDALYPDLTQAEKDASRWFTNNILNRVATAPRLDEVVRLNIDDTMKHLGIVERNLPRMSLMSVFLLSIIAKCAGEKASGKTDFDFWPGEERRVFALIVPEGPTAPPFPV